MKIRMTTKTDEIDAFLNANVKEVENQTVRILARLGEESVNEARDRTPEQSWIDQTGNLRSSIGYEIMSNGKSVLMSAFPAVKNGQEGSTTGKNAVRELSKRNGTGYSLIIVAGMKYAPLVEARENKCVLASAELNARKKLPEYLSDIRRKIAR